MALRLAHQNDALPPAAPADDSHGAQIDGELLRQLIRDNARLTFRFRADGAVAHQWRGKKVPLRRLKGKIRKQAAEICRLLKKLKKQAARAQTVEGPALFPTGLPRIVRSPEEQAVHFLHSATGYEKARIRECLAKPFDANRVIFRLAADDVFSWIQVKRGDGTSHRYTSLRPAPTHG